MANENGFEPNGMMMDIERFTEIVEAYGAAPDLWPVAERETAMAFADREPAARELLEQERALDMALGSIQTIKPSAQLTEVILADAADVMDVLVPIAEAQKSSGPQPAWLSGLRGLIADIDGMDWSLRGLVQPGAVLACAALAGLATGVFIPANGSSEILYTFEDEDVLSVAFGQADYGLETWTLNGEGQ